ncbi:MAG: S8 family serine peptidase [Bacteroidetes bacterium]|nr:S8 family serine peptidase [Bacteroidota bacterium]MDA1337041.1 S8 family serine peptidase [Bacteroidota bacterium]
MRVRLLITVSLLVFSFTPIRIVAQNAPDRYWVQFEGKVNSELPAGFSTPFSINSPEEFLSPKALERRARQGIPITAHDLPIPPSHLASLDSIQSIQVILKSKWFNAVTILVKDSTFDVQSLLALPTVIDIRSVQSVKPNRPSIMEIMPTRASANDTSAYGGGWNPISQLHANWLHGLGFRGQGMMIAVLDAGFENVESLPIFERAWQQNRIWEGMDAMQSQGGLFAHHRHGTAVLGTMAGHLEDSLIGTAPDAHYVLYRTEDAYSEYLIEEDYWVAAAEHADSMGVDLMNTSLGYSTFDDSTMNHTVLDLDGITCRISQAAQWAAQKGILCVTSAGNSGSTEWHAITAPGDAKDILTVGAIDANGNHASFSGWGPTADGRIKPEIMALGVQAAYPHADSTIRYGNGTSFSSPIVCGAAACLWQAFPDATASEIRSAIISSSSDFLQPSDSMGYGIPDFRLAFEILSQEGATVWDAAATTGLIFPNPSNDGILRWLLESDSTPTEWKLFTSGGQLLRQGSVSEWKDMNGRYQGWVQFDHNLTSGQYIFQLLNKNQPLYSAHWTMSRQ